MDKASLLGSAAFDTALGVHLHAEAERLFDWSMSRMEEEVAQGFACFHPAPHWFSANLPAPVLNDSGRRHAIELLKLALARGPYVSEWLLNLPALPDYRSHLHPGHLDADTVPGIDEPPRDEVANAVTLRLAREKNRHFRFEIGQQQESGWLELLRRGTRTPEPYISDESDEAPVPRRDADVPVEHDTAYWQAVYAQPLRRAHEFNGVDKPDWILQLMADMAPDFKVDMARSGKQALRFVQNGEGEVAWAIEYRRASGVFDHRPWLVCLPRAGRLKPRQTPVAFPSGLIHSSPPLDVSARGIECALPYWLPRMRSLAVQLDPIVQRALDDAAAAGTRP